MTSPGDSEPALHIAVVGAGPKALHALERLVAHLRPDQRTVAVTIFEPTTPGAGPAYDPALDPSLLVNLRAELIDAWPRSGDQAVPIDDQHLPYPAWAASNRVSDDAYPPRRDVGHYLHAAFRQVARDAASRFTLIERQTPVSALRRAPAHAWELLDDQGRELGRFNEVLLATGHDRLTHGGDARRLDQLALQGGETIVTRGFGLTTLDLIRIIEARGAWADGTLVHAVSRSGRPPLAKPAPILDDQLRAACGDPDALPWPEHGALSVAWLRAATLQLAGNLLAVASDAPADLPALERALAELESRTPITVTEARHRLRESLEVAIGAIPPGPVAAIGVAWRVLQQGLTVHGSFGGLPAPELPELRRYAGALELIAFGPPVAAARSLLHALNLGTVKVHRTDPSGLPEKLVASADIVVDTVLAPPGVVNGSLIASLVDQGMVLRVPHGRGVLVDRCGAALDQIGGPVPGLSLIGRPTEDSVLANDTLSRTMHDVADHWAARIAARAGWLDAAQPAAGAAA